MIKTNSKTSAKSGKDRSMNIKIEIKEIENKEKLGRINKDKNWVFGVTTKLIIPWKEQLRINEGKQR